MAGFQIPINSTGNTPGTIDTSTGQLTQTSPTSKTKYADANGVYHDTPEQAADADKAIQDAAKKSQPTPPATPTGGKLAGADAATDADTQKRLAGGDASGTGGTMVDGVLYEDGSQELADAQAKAAQKAKTFDIPIDATGKTPGTIVTDPSTGSTTIVGTDKTTQTTGDVPGAGGFQVPVDATGYTPGTIVNTGDETKIIDSAGQSGPNNGGKDANGSNPAGYTPPSITPGDITDTSTETSGGGKTSSPTDTGTLAGAGTDLDKAKTAMGVDKPLGSAAPAYTSTAVNPLYSAQGKDMQKSAEASYGGSAAEALKKAMTAGQDYASDQASRAAANAGRESSAYARANGLSPAQAALMAGQQSGDQYNTAYSTNLNNAVNEYGQLAGQMGQLGTTQEGLGLQKYNADLGKYSTDVGQDVSRNQIASNQWQAQLGNDTTRYGIDVGADTTRYGIDKGVAQAQQQNNDNWWGSLFSAGAALLPLAFSDENAKTDIKDGYGILERVTRVVNPKTFNYKPGLGEDPSKERVGVLAQDLEKTPLAATVKTMSNGLKAVDTGQLSLGNTAMISELSKKVDMIAKMFKGAQYA